jgi:hypothetical protein
MNARKDCSSMFAQYHFVHVRPAAALKWAFVYAQSPDGYGYRQPIVKFLAHLCRRPRAWTVQTGGVVESDGFARVEVLHKAVRI